MKVLAGISECQLLSSVSSHWQEKTFLKSLLALSIHTAYGDDSKFSWHHNHCELWRSLTNWKTTGRSTFSWLGWDQDIMQHACALNFFVRMRSFGGFRRESVVDIVFGITLLIWHVHKRANQKKSTKKKHLYSTFRLPKRKCRSSSTSNSLSQQTSQQFVKHNVLARLPRQSLSSLLQKEVHDELDAGVLR